MKDQENISMLYFLSLYYKKSTFSGANKRFDEMGKILANTLGNSFKIIITEGEKPNWIDEKNCLYVKPYSSKIGRIKSYFQLIDLLQNLTPGNVISDFMPIPFSGLKKHTHYQLIYDLRNFTDYKRGGLSFLTPYFQKRQLQKSNNILTISEATKNDINKKCLISKAKISVSYCGIDRGFLEETERFKDIDILYVATFEKRKNHVNLLHAIKNIDRKLKITFVGQDHGELEKIKSLASEVSTKNGSEFSFIHKVSEEDLMKLYERAKIFTFPSFVEGFGMPIIEAMAKNCNIVCSNIDVFKEICGDEAIYFDPYNISSISNSILMTLDKNQQLESKNVEKFLWENIVDKLLNELNINR